MAPDDISDDMGMNTTQTDAPHDDTTQGLVTIDLLLHDLASPRRRTRQDAAHELALVAQEKASELLDHIKELERALTVKEAQTRWEILRCLAHLAEVDAAKTKGAYRHAEVCLFDDESSVVRMSACHFLCVYGAQAEKNSDKVAGILDEFMQCYHGDPEYRDILLDVLTLASGKISKKTARILNDRVSFDAENGRGYIRKFSADIIEALTTKLS